MIFLSYSREQPDEHIAREIAGKLTKAGVDVWLDQEGIRPGNDFPLVIENAINNCTLFLFLLSPNSVDSAWCAHELALAHKFDKRIIPLKLMDVGKRIPIIVRKLHHLDAHDISNVVNEIVRELSPSGYSIVSIGSGTVESAYRVEGACQLGDKHPFSFHEKVTSGGGVNFASRLLAMGRTVFPILSIGDDPGGSMVRADLLEYAKQHYRSDSLLTFIKEQLLIPGMKTRHSITISNGEMRTILFSKLSERPDLFLKHLKTKLPLIAELNGSVPQIVRIAHLYCDSKKVSPDSPCQCTKHIIRQISESTFLVGSMGRSQLEMGLDFWKDDLRKFGLLQFSLSELRTLFKVDGGTRVPLAAMVSEVRKLGVAIVITVGRLGAIGIHPERPEQLLVAEPLKISDIEDPSGAGDAFSAGMIHSLRCNEGYTYPAFEEAIKVGRLWGACACTTLGGANDCPDADRLKEFEHGLENKNARVDLLAEETAKWMLDLLDRGYLAD